MPWKDIRKRKVLLILSSIIKSRKFEYSMKMIAIAPASLIYIAIREDGLYTQLVWGAIALSIPIGIAKARL